MTYADANTFAPSTAASAERKPAAGTRRPSLMRRLYDAIIRSRTLSAERELRWHAAFVEPSVLANAGLTHLAVRDAANRLPFGA